MGAIGEWLDTQLKSPVGQIVWLLVAATARLAYGYLRRHPKRHHRPHGRSSRKA